MCFFIFFFSADDFPPSNVTLDTATFFSFFLSLLQQQLDGFIRIFLETGLDPLLVLYFMMRLLYPPFHPLASSTLNLLRSVVDSRRRRRRWTPLFFFFIFYVTMGCTHVFRIIQHTQRSFGDGSPSDWKHNNNKKVKETRRKEPETEHFIVTVFCRSIRYESLMCWA
jgi:hypothetical protein